MIPSDILTPDPQLLHVASGCWCDVRACIYCGIFYYIDSTDNETSLKDPQTNYT